jgi:hypothetical protein
LEASPDRPHHDLPARRPLQPVDPINVTTPPDAGPEVNAVRTDPRTLDARLDARLYASSAPALLAVNDLGQVIAGLQAWIMGLLAGLATLFLVIGGLRYVLAAGDPSEIDRAKAALKSAAVGYALAVLAPVLMTALREILGV